MSRRTRSAASRRAHKRVQRTGLQAASGTTVAAALTALFPTMHPSVATLLAGFCVWAVTIAQNWIELKIGKDLV